MKVKVLGIIFVLVLGIVIVINCISHYTYAYSYEVDESILFHEEDVEVLEENIEKYLEKIDDLLLVNSKFEYSEVLVENYDFLVYFAMDYMLRHSESYQKRIIIGEEFSYQNRELENKSTNQYVSLEDIYDITEKYFGIKGFKIINEDVFQTGDYVSLIDYTEELFLLNIQDVVVNVQEDLILAKVFYEGEQCYLYTFINQNQILKIKNIEVLS